MVMCTSLPLLSIGGTCVKLILSFLTKSLVQKLTPSEPYNLQLALPDDPTLTNFIVRPTH